MFNIGDTIKIKNSNLVGVIVSISSSDVIVNINNKKIHTSLNNIVKVADKIIKTNKTVIINFNLDTNADFSNEIMIRHQNKDEALDNLDKFINKAALNNKSIVKIIHGKNGGILRKAVHEYLKQSDLVLSYRLGYPHEGSYGVTIAFLI